MKIAIVDFSGKGGIGHYSYSLFKALKSSNPETVLLTTSDFEFETEDGVFSIMPSHVDKPLKIIKGMFYIFSLLKVFRFFMKERCDIVHFHESKLPILETALFTFLAKRKSKIVMTSHNIFRAEARYVPYSLKKLYKRVDGVIFHSETNKEDLMKQIDFRSAKMWKIIPHGNYRLLVNPEFNKEKARQILEIGSNKLVVLFFGFIRQYKGLEILINAISKLRLQFKDVYLLIAGKEIESYKKYDDMIKRLELEEFVQAFPYYIPNSEISTFFEACDVVVLPYKRIFQSGVIQLAFAHSLPVIASDIGGIPDLVIDGKTGFLVKPGDPHLLASKLEKFFLLSETKRKQMGVYGKTLSEDLYSWDDIAKNTLDFYANLM